MSLPSPKRLAELCQIFHPLNPLKPFERVYHANLEILPGIRFSTPPPQPRSRSVSPAGIQMRSKTPDPKAPGMEFDQPKLDTPEFRSTDGSSRKAAYKPVQFKSNVKPSVAFSDSNFGNFDEFKGSNGSKATNSFVDNAFHEFANGKAPEEDAFAAAFPQSNSKEINVWTDDSTWDIFDSSAKSSKKAPAPPASVPFRTNVNQPDSKSAFANMPKFKSTSHPPPNDLGNDVNTQDTIRQMRQHISILTRQNETLKTQNDQKTQHIEQLLKDIQNINSKNQQLSTQVNTHSGEIEAEITDMVRQLNTKQQQLDEANQQRDKAIFEQGKIARESNARLVRLQEEHNTLQNTLKQAESLMVHLKDNFENSNDVSVMRKELEAREAEISNLMGELANKHIESQVLEDSLKGTDRQYKVLRSQYLDPPADVEALNDELEADLQAKLARQKAMIVREANLKMEDLERTIELLTFELDRKTHVGNSLQKEIEKKSEELVKAQTELEFYEGFKQRDDLLMNEKSKVASSNFARVAAELDVLRNTKEGLEDRCKELEDSLRDKDLEVVQCRHEIHDFEEQIRRLKREIGQLKFDIDMKDTQILDFDNLLRKLMGAKEEDMNMRTRMQLEVAEDEYGKKMKDMQELYDEMLQKQTRQLKETEIRLNSTQSERDSLAEKYFEILDLLDRRNAELKHLKTALFEIEGKVVASNQAREVEALKQANRELKRIILAKYNPDPQDEQKHKQLKINEEYMLPTRSTLQLKDGIDRGSHTNRAASLENSSKKPDDQLALTHGENDLYEDPSKQAIFQHSYQHVKGDPIDSAMEKFLANRGRQYMLVQRLGPGMYLIAGQRRTVSFDGADLLLNVNNEWIPLKDYFLDTGFDRHISQLNSSKRFVPTPAADLIGFENLLA